MSDEFDINEALGTIREIVAAVRSGEMHPGEVWHLVDLVETLDQMLVAGGRLPADWQSRAGSQGKGQGVSIHPGGQALSPDLVVEQRSSCPMCGNCGLVKAEGCTCGGTDIGVGIMHEPGCGFEPCPVCGGQRITDATS